MLGLPLFCNNLMLVLDRRFVHRLRMVTGKAGNPLNEVVSPARSSARSSPSSGRPDRPHTRAGARLIRGHRNAARRNNSVSVMAAAAIIGPAIGTV
jgi:hypothetical protein